MSDIVEIIVDENLAQLAIDAAAEVRNLYNMIQQLVISGTVVGYRKTFVYKSGATQFQVPVNVAISCVFLNEGRLLREESGECKITNNLVEVLIPLEENDEIYVGGVGRGVLAVNCVVSDWSAWSACANGTQSRSRTVITHASNGGTACPVLQESQACSIPLPVNCVVSDWSAWSACVNGTQSRSRTVLTHASNGGTACPILQESQACSIPLPVDCVVSEWSAWSDCAGGTQTRERKIITPASNGGTACPAVLVEYQACTAPPSVHVTTGKYGTMICSSQTGTIGIKAVGNTNQIYYANGLENGTVLYKDNLLTTPIPSTWTFIKTNDYPLPAYLEITDATIDNIYLEGSPC
jgi:hypothetical protein